MTIHYAYEDQINESLFCPICRCPFVDPVELNCRHVFCQPCIQRALQLSSTCPVDRIAVTVVQPASQIIKSLVDDLPVRCSNAKRGCRFVGPRDTLPGHARDCSFKKTKKRKSFVEPSDPSTSTTHPSTRDGLVHFYDSGKAGHDYSRALSDVTRTHSDSHPAHHDPDKSYELTRQPSSSSSPATSPTVAIVEPGFTLHPVSTSVPSNVPLAKASSSADPWLDDPDGPLVNVQDSLDSPVRASTQSSSGHRIERHPSAQELDATSSRSSDSSLRVGKSRSMTERPDLLPSSETSGHRSYEPSSGELFTGLEPMLERLKATETSWSTNTGDGCQQLATIEGPTVQGFAHNSPTKQRSQRAQSDTQDLSNEGECDLSFRAHADRRPSASPLSPKAKAQTTSCQHCGSDSIRHLPQHLLECAEVPVPCPHARFGCPARLPRFELNTTHLKTNCAFEPMKHFFQTYEDRALAAEQQVLLLDQRCSVLESAMSQILPWIQAANSENGSNSHQRTSPSANPMAQGSEQSEAQPRSSLHRSGSSNGHKDESPRPELRAQHLVSTSVTHPPADEEQVKALSAVNEAVRAAEERTRQSLQRCQEDLQALFHSHHELSTHVHFITNDVARLALRDSGRNEHSRSSNPLAFESGTLGSDVSSSSGSGGEEEYWPMDNRSGPLQQPAGVLNVFSRHPPFKPNHSPLPLAHPFPALPFQAPGMPEYALRAPLRRSMTTHASPAQSMGPIKL